MTRQKEFLIKAADSRQRWEDIRRREQEKRAYLSGNTPVGNSNTLGPQEDVVESRRFTRKHVDIAMPRSASTKSLLAENIALLILLVLSIYGLYRLSIYLLNQS